MSFALYYPVRSCVRIYIYISTVLQQSVCLVMLLSILSKGVYKHSSVKRIATESLNINYTCWYTLFLIPLLLSFWWSASSNTTKTPKLGGDMDTMSPDQHVWGKCGNPSCQLTLGELGKLGRLSCLEPRHGLFSYTCR